LKKYQSVYTVVRIYFFPPVISCVNLFQAQVYLIN